MPCKHFIGGTPCFAIEAVNRQAGGRVGAGRDFRVFLADDAVLGAEKRDEFYAGRVRENVDGAAAFAVHAGLIGDQADALALQRSEIFLLEDVNARERVIAAMIDAVEAVRTLRVNAALDFRGEARCVANVQRGGNSVGNFRANARSGRAHVWVNAVGEKNDERLAGGVDPHGRAGEAGVSVGAKREKIAARRRERRVNVPAQSANVGTPGRRLRRGHFVDCGGGKNPASASGNAAAVEKHLAINRHVVSGGKKPRVARNAADGARARVVHDAAEDVAEAGAGLRAGRQIDLLGGSDVGNPGCGRKKARVLHPERTIEMFFGVFVEAFAGETLHQFAEQNEICVAVNEAIAGRVHQRFVVDFLHERVFAAERGGKRRVWRESGCVCHQHANGDLIFAVRTRTRACSARADR